MPTIAPYGTWNSPISTDMLVSGAVGISEVIPTHNSLWWAESRPSEGGRTAIMCLANDQQIEVTPPGTNVRTTVHEYGGSAWWVDMDVLYFVDYHDQRIRRMKLGAEPVFLSPEPRPEQSLRYADFRCSEDKHWLVCVGEFHNAELAEPKNTLVAIACDGSQKTTVLQQGYDFYSSPRISRDGKKLAWIQWNHPNMPWDNTELLVADIQSTAESIALVNPQLLAGGVDEAIIQPAWSPDNKLHFLSDRNDLWQLYVLGNTKPVLELDGEIGYPPWNFGFSHYAFTAQGKVIATRFKNGVGYLDKFPTYSTFNSIRTSGDNSAFVAASWDAESTVFLNNKIARPPRELGLDKSLLAPPEQLQFPTTDHEHAYALYFRPANSKFVAPDNEKPPLIVLAHGGPTSSARSHLNLARQFWTSRGFAVVDVNYRGSSGFGRRYRKRLEGQWGIADVDDCVSAARYLVGRGDVDPKRLIIRGGSAGGFTVLSALAFHDTFSAGANMYGVADLSLLANDTHKFESRYLDGLVGPFPEASELYDKRSPINHLHGFSAPMIVLQGSEDAVVPPDQSRKIVDALDQRGVPVAYIEYEGEQHGFRQGDTIKHALASELSFYGKVFRFKPADNSVDIEIRNLENNDTT